MAEWHKDRNRQLKKRAVAEEFEHQQRQWTPRPDRVVPPRMSKAVLRAIGEEAVRQYAQEQLGRSDSSRGSLPNKSNEGRRNMSSDDIRKKTTGLLTVLDRRRNHVR